MFMLIEGDWNVVPKSVLEDLEFSAVRATNTHKSIINTDLIISLYG